MELDIFGFEVGRKYFSFYFLDTYFCYDYRAFFSIEMNGFTLCGLDIFFIKVI